MAARYEKIAFTGADGDQLAGRLDLSDGRPQAYRALRASHVIGKERSASIAPPTK